MEKHIITLSKPIRVGDEEVIELTLKEPTLDSIEEVNLTIQSDGSFKIKLGDLLPFIVRSANIPLSSVRKISITDLPKFMEAFFSFLDESQTQKSEQE